MSHLSRPYNPEEHRPDDFLGRFVDLPEIAHLPYHQVLERPVTSVDDVLGFVDKTVMVYGYDKLLPKEKWGVWQARYLEAAWWRLQDAVSANPRLPGSWSKDVRDKVRSGHGPGCVSVYLGGYSSAGRVFMKDMSFEFSAGALEERVSLDFSREEGWPVLAPEKQILGLPGVAERERFWEPLNAYSVAQAMSAWNATRFGKRKFAVEFLDHPGANPCDSFAKTFGPAAGTHLMDFLMQGEIADPVPSSVPGPSARL